MKRILRKLENINDPRQPRKIKHSLSDVVGLVLLGTLANATEWTEIELFGREYEDLLKEYLELKNGIPSHDTIQRVMAIIPPEVLQQLVLLWNELLNSNEGEKLKKIINIDGKTMKGSATAEQSPLHIVSAWSNSDGISLGQRTVLAKENEIVAIPELLKVINIKGHVVTIDAMGTQTKIAKEIINQKGNYVLAVKGNHPNLHEGIKEYFNDSELLKEVKKNNGYYKTVEKARGQLEIREYFQSKDIKWLYQKENWAKVKTIGMVKTTIRKGEQEKIEYRYYIGSIKVDIKLFAKAVRGHWSIESMHWHLDVTFGEDKNRTVDRRANENFNIIRKWSLAILKLFTLDKEYSLRKKRYIIGLNPPKRIRQIMEI